MSNGNSCIMSPGETNWNLYNWVNEWGYSYAAINVATMGDSAVNMHMWW